MHSHSFNEENETNVTKEKNKSKALDFPFKPKDINLKNHNILNLSKEDSMISIENVDIEMLTINEENKKREELKISLEHLYDGFLEKYNKKEYLELITEIETKEELFYVNSIESFKIYILKIKSIIRLMINNYYKAIIKENHTNDNIVKENTTKILNEFKKIKSLINKNSKYENEIITQVYCKFLIFLSLYESRKDNRIKSLSYITLGINMMKIYFVKDNIATDIKTYFNYLKLVLLLINNLIGDCDFKGSTYYVNLGFRILNIIFRNIHYYKLPKKYYMRAIEYSSFNYIYSGICLEYNSNNMKNIMDSFIQANYFLEKSNSINNSSPFSSIFKNRNNRLKYENMFYLVSNSTIKAIKNDLKKKEKEIEFLMQKTKEEKEKEEKLSQNISERKEKLKLISHGLSTNFKKFLPVEEKIYNNILTQKVKINIEKSDKELADFVYNNKKNNRKISNEIKYNLCRYEIYNDLLSEKFREFVVKNKQLKFNNPNNILDNLNKVRAYINIKDIDITKDNKEGSKSFNLKNKIKKSRNLTLNNLKETTTFSEDFKTSFIYNGHKSIKSYSNKPYVKNLKKNHTHLISNRNNDEIYLKKRNKFQSKTLSHNKKNFKIFNFKTYQKNNSTIKLSKTNNNIKKNKDKKYYSYNIKLRNDFDRNYLDKYLATKQYQKKFFLYENLIRNDLKFQKYYLNSKNFNSKLYFDDHQKELIKIEDSHFEKQYFSKEKAFKEFTIINTKVTDEICGNKADLKRILDEHKKKITSITKGFKLLGKTQFEGEKLKNCMSKVIQRYIIENREKRLGKITNYVDNEQIKKKNESQINKINKSIKKISYHIYKKKMDYKNSN